MEDEKGLLYACCITSPLSFADSHRVSYRLLGQCGENLLGKMSKGARRNSNHLVTRDLLPNGSLLFCSCTHSAQHISINAYRTSVEDRVTFQLK